jgi:hypothetical protein
VLSHAASSKVASSFDFVEFGLYPVENPVRSRRIPSMGLRRPFDGQLLVGVVESGPMALLRNGKKLEIGIEFVAREKAGGAEGGAAGGHVFAANRSAPRGGEGASASGAAADREVSAGVSGRSGQDQFVTDTTVELNVELTPSSKVS